MSFMDCCYQQSRHLFIQLYYVDTYFTKLFLALSYVYNCTLSLLLVPITSTPQLCETRNTLSLSSIMITMINMLGAHDVLLRRSSTCLKLNLEYIPTFTTSSVIILHLQKPYQSLEKAMLDLPKPRVPLWQTIHIETERIIFFHFNTQHFSSMLYTCRYD